jgi:predicted metal-dependent hydrolase
MTVNLQGKEFTLIHRTNKKIKRVGILLENKDEIIIRTPLKFKTHLLKQIVYEHENWILRAINKVKSKTQFDFKMGTHIPFMGKNCKLELIEDDSIKTVKVVYKNEVFYFYHNRLIYEYKDFLEALKLFYKKVSKKYIDPIFDEWCFRTQLNPNNTSYRYAKKRWGSCSYVNNISINYMLLQFPIRAIEYVVLHELCHIKEKNHSKRFYSLLSLYMEDYKQQEEILNNSYF